MMGRAYEKYLWRLLGFLRTRYAQMPTWLSDWCEQYGHSREISVLTASSKGEAGAWEQEVPVARIATLSMNENQKDVESEDPAKHAISAEDC